METKQRMFNKQDDPYNAWIRTVPELSSVSTGVRAYDVDLSIWNTNTLYFAHIETKTNSAFPPSHQILTMQMTRIAWETSNKDLIRKYLSSKPYVSHDRDLVYRGYWLLQYEKSNLNEGSASVRPLVDNGFSNKFITIKSEKDLLYFTETVLGMISGSNAA
jgi:hypothetical protein